jgi:DNA-binding transcriptional regulator YiaG
MVRRSQFQSAARRGFWTVHIQGWRESGLSMAKYCAHHRLPRRAFSDWRRAFEALHLIEDEAELQQARKRRKARPALSKDAKSRFVQAYWAMHVEAMVWSGMSLGKYAAALRLPEGTLRKWYDRVERGEALSDWRALLHPSARAMIRPVPSPSPKDDGGLTEGEAKAARRKRRRWSEAEKLTMVQASEADGVTISEVARAHGVTPPMLFRWRAQQRRAQADEARLVSVVLADGDGAGILPRIGAEAAP